jgi:hypothetical protein
MAAARLDGGAPFCVKLRSAAPAVCSACTSADRELANMLALATSPAAQQLFQQLLFHFCLDLPARPGGGPSSLVSIGMEHVELTLTVPEVFTDANGRLVVGLVAAALRHVRRLHAAGLATHTPATSCTTSAASPAAPSASSPSASMPTASAPSAPRPPRRAASRR